MSPESHHYSMASRFIYRASCASSGVSRVSRHSVCTVARESVGHPQQECGVNGQIATTHGRLFSAYALYTTSNGVAACTNGGTRSQPSRAFSWPRLAPKCFPRFCVVLIAIGVSEPLHHRATEEALQGLTYFISPSAPAPLALLQKSSQVFLPQRQRHRRAPPSRVPGHPRRCA
jgi:hypothetical protein